MPARRRVIGAEHVAAARRTGRSSIEVMPGDIVTTLARDSAERLGVKLLDGPREKPAAPMADGAAAMRRSLYRRSPRWITSKRQGQVSRGRALRKLGLIGAGGVGANIAHLAANDGIAEQIALVDIAPGIASSVALDLNHASGITRSRSGVVGGTDFGLIADSDVVVVTAGRPRTPGMTRADLVQINRRVIEAAAEAIKTHAPKAVVIVITNPLDEMTAAMLEATSFPRERVLGMAGTLDSSRFRNALARAAGVSPAGVEAVTLGSHGDEMVPIVSQARIKGRRLDVFLGRDKIDACVQDAITGGGQVVALRKTGSATLAPAHALVELLEHIRGARAGAVPVSVMLEGEYGVRGVVLGVPCHLSEKGLVAVDEINLADSELQALRRAAAAVQERLRL